MNKQAITPQPEMKGLTFWPIPEFCDAEMVFGAGADAFFSRHDLPEVPRAFVDKANSLFVKGGKVQFPDAVDHEKAVRALRAWITSWAPAHEAKETTVGYALWLWSTPEALVKQSEASQRSQS